MATYRLNSIADLARQLEFAPTETRHLQAALAENLLHQIDPAKAYPLEFVVFRITSYHPRGLGPDLLTGLAIQHDLGLLIEQLSESLDLRSAEASEPVLAIEDVTEKFNVTSKTIQRWRRRGLPSRRFTFPDGRKRVGFLLSSVERFFAARGEQVVGGVNLSKIDGTELAEILRRARRLAIAGCSEDEITRRIGRRLDRSPLTILHTVRKHDQENPADSIFALATPALDEQAVTRIRKCYRTGITLSRLAKKAKRPRSTIYRLVLDDRIEKLARRKIRFIDDPLYREAGAADIITSIAQQNDLRASAAGEEMRIPRDLPPYLQSLYRTPLLSPARERALFLQFNFHKFQFVSARRKLDPQFARSRDLRRLEEFAHLTNRVKNQIVQANLRLVVSIARKHLRFNLNLMELISDGNITLMRAVESFDTHKGNRFSTYATLSLMKGFARGVPRLQSQVLPIHRVPIAMELPDARNVSSDARLIERDEVRHLLARLDERERRVLLAHYGLQCDNADQLPATFEQVAQSLGLSTHRVRQIERTAIMKLRSEA